MTTSLLQEEIEIIKKLKEVGGEDVKSIVSVLMLTREHARPKLELVDILKQYQGLDDEYELRRAIDSLIQDGFIEESEKHKGIIKYSKKLEETVIKNGKSTEDKIREIRIKVRPRVEYLGDITKEDVYNSYLEILERAQSEIYMPMISTTPELKSVEILKKRAKNGVKVKLLIGNPDIISKYRGKANQSIYEKFIEKWSQETEGYEDIEIRIMSRLEDIEMGTCVLVDNKILRLDIYDPYNQRSLQGVVLECANEGGMNLNIIRTFKRQFDVAWSIARKNNENKLIYYLRQNHIAIIAIIFWCITIVLYNEGMDLLSSILGSVSAAFLYDFVKSKVMLKIMISKLTRGR